MVIWDFFPTKPVKEELIVDQGVVGAKFDNLLVSSCLGSESKLSTLVTLVDPSVYLRQKTKSGIRDLLQHFPQHFMSVKDLIKGMNVLT